MCVQGISPLGDSFEGTQHSAQVLPTHPTNAAPTIGIKTVVQVMHSNFRDRIIMTDLLNRHRDDYPTVLGLSRYPTGALQDQAYQWDSEHCTRLGWCLLGERRLEHGKTQAMRVQCRMNTSHRPSTLQAMPHPSATRTTTIDHLSTEETRARASVRSNRSDVGTHFESSQSDNPRIRCQEPAPGKLRPGQEHRSDCCAQHRLERRHSGFGEPAHEGHDKFTSRDRLPAQRNEAFLVCAHALLAKKHKHGG